MGLGAAPLAGVVRAALPDVAFPEYYKGTCSSLASPCGKWFHSCSWGYLQRSDIGVGALPTPGPAVGLLLAVQSRLVPAAGGGSTHLVLLEELILHLAPCLSFPPVSENISSLCNTMMHMSVCW